MLFRYPLSFFDIAFLCGHWQGADDQQPKDKADALKYALPHLL